MAILDAITRFLEVFNQEEKNFGALHLLDSEQVVPDKLLPVGQLQTFYAQVEFDELIVGSTFFLEIAALADLPRYQEGWRWVYDADPAGREDTEHWQPSWLVFGDKDGDALFTKLLDTKSPVFGSLQKTEEYHLASSFESFLDILSACLVMERDEFQYATKLEDYTVKPTFINRTRVIVEQYESPEIAGRFIDFFFG